jgi:hypothetical protein
MESIFMWFELAENNRNPFFFFPAVVLLFACAVTQISDAQEPVTVSTENPVLLFADWLAAMGDIPVQYARTGNTHMPVITKSIYRSGRRPVKVGKDNVVMYPQVIDTDSIHPEASGLTVEFVHQDNPKQMFYVPFNSGWTSETLKDEGVMIAPPNVKLEGKMVQIGASEGVKLPYVRLTPPIQIVTESTLQFSVGMEEKALLAHDKGDLIFQKYLSFPVTPLRYIVTVVGDSLKEEVFRTQYPRPGRAHLWDNAEIDLEKYIGKTVQFEFRVEDSGLWKRGELPPGSVLPLWGNPRVTAARPPKDDLPNFILVSLDTLRADHLGAYGYERDTSPFLDQLAADSYLFEKCIANSSWTIPSHSSLFTGMPLFTHRMGGKFTWKLDSEFETIAELFRANGYSTAAFTEGGAVTGSLGFRQGFGTYSDGSMPPSPSGSASLTFQMAKNWLGYNHTQPFFCFVHTYEIHMPYTPPPLFASKFTEEERAPVDHLETENKDPRYRQYVIDRYDGGIAYTDSMLGEFWKQLETLGVLDNTYVFIFSDHGEEFWDHNGVEHGFSLFQEQLHVPLIVHFPKGTPGGKRIPDLVSLSDVYSTLVELAGFTPNRQSSDSYSLVPLMSGNGSYPRDAVFSQLVTTDFGLHLAYQNSNWKYLMNASYVKDGSPVFNTDLEKDTGLAGTKEDDFTSAEEQKLVSHFMKQRPFGGDVPSAVYSKDPPPQHFLYDLTRDWDEKKPLLKDEANIVPDLYGALIAMVNGIDARSAELTPKLGQGRALDESEQEALRALGYID